jgi:hypothetical protein
MKLRHSAMLLAGFVCCGAAVPQSVLAQYIWINVSIKAAINPVDGTYPGGTTLSNIQYQYDQAIARVNEIHGAFGRGYRYRRVEDVQSIGALGDFSGPGKWSLMHTGDDDYSIVEAETNSVPYKWNFSAANILCFEEIRSNTPPYGFAGGVAWQLCGQVSPCGCPGEFAGLAYHQRSWSEGWQIGHESGHLFGLPHTFSSAHACSTIDSSFWLNGYLVGDDGFDDTLPESSGMTRDQITLANFVLVYTNCNAEQQLKADNTYFNMMSYHGGLNGEPRDQVTTRLTEEQLDAFADYASDPAYHRNMSSGATRFVGTDGADATGTGRSKCPYRSVTKAANVNDDPGDVILMLRPGNYSERPRLTNRMALRVTRSGPASIGKP